MFSHGFEKEAGLKHWLAGAAIAASPVKAKANDMTNAVGKALQKTEMGKTVEHTVNKHLSKLKSYRLFGEEAAGAASKGGGGAKEVAKKLKPSLDIEDGKRLKFNYGKFHAHAEKGKAGATFDLPKGAKIDVADTGGDRSFRIGFERSF